MGKTTVEAEMQGQPTHDRQDFSWAFWPIVPLYPYGKRRTLRQEVVANTIWIFDQIQGILYVTVPIRMTAVKLEAGGLLIYAPVAPTPECIRLVQELVDQHGQVKYIILPTVTGIEHKVFVGPFARRFPQAQVFVAPHQWSFPLNLPLSWLGLPPKRTHILPETSSQTPFAAEFDYAILGPIDLNLGPFAEVAFLHKQSRTLLVTDAVLAVPEVPPPIVQIDPYPLLFHARDSALEPIADSEANRRKGWQRISLFAFYFRPSALNPVQLGRTLRHAWNAPDRSRQAYFGLLPFQWKSDWEQSFIALRGNGRLFVAPILQTLILDRSPQITLDWVGKVAGWEFQQIISCHFEAPLAVTPYQFQQAFDFLRNPTRVELGHGNPPLPITDFEFLLELEQNLSKIGVTPPPH